VVDGDPGRLLGVVDEESALWEAAERAGRFAVTALAAGDRQLADRFAGLMPAPGGLFANGDWHDTAYGPVPAGHPTWAGCRLDGARPLGWGLLVEATIETVEIGDPATPLVHYRARYHDL
jgi:flavin reductase (DIM6/NTAB) family NADH-FMN oxidoreductase RutF